MNCKKCGAPLVPGQVICSNCDTDNSQVFNQQSINEFQSQNFQNNFSYNPQFQNYQNEYNVPITNNDLESNTTNNTNKNKKNVAIIVGIIVFTILLIPTIIGIFMILSTKQVNSQISKARINSFISEYQMLNKQVRINIAEGSVVACYDDCEDYYDVDSSQYFFRVTDKGDYYELSFEVNKDKYGNVEFTNEDCYHLSNSICNKNKITGKLYKE